MQRILFFTLTALVVGPQHVAAFSSSPSIIQISRGAYHIPRSKVSLQQSTENTTTEAEETDDVTCFIVNEEEIISEGEKPHVVCTSEPDDVSLLHALLHCGEYNFSYLFQHSHIIVFPYSMLIVDGCSMLGSTEWIQRK